MNISLPSRLWSCSELDMGVEHLLEVKAGAANIVEVP